MDCPQSGCEGYELVRSLDFDDAASYASGTVNTMWTSGAGWLPIGVDSGWFNTIFEGNDHTIANLFINRSGTSDQDVAGLFGQSRRGSDTRNVGLVDVDITAVNRVGGLIGINHGSITSSYATSSVNGNRDVGGLVGRFRRGNVTSSYSTGSVNANSNVGGLVGSSGDNITYSYATGNVFGNFDNVGGLVGYGDDGSITSSHATGIVTGERHVGGLAGYSRESIISSYAIGSVTGNKNVGGLVGGGVNITSSYATGNLKGNEQVGGLAGYGCNIIASYATGSVTGSSEGSKIVGGLIGGNDGSVTASYSIGSVSGNTSVGGLVGENDEQSSIIDGYWNTETSGQSAGVGRDSTDGVEGKTTAELQVPTGYTGIYIPWYIDFDNADNDFDMTTGKDDFGTLVHQTNILR